MGEEVWKLSERIAVGGWRSAVRKIDHKLTVCGTADDCLNCDLWDREWNSLLQKKRRSRVELAPTSTSPYFFIERTTKLKAFLRRESFRLVAIVV